MTTSGVTTLGYTANQIFQEALDDIGVAADGDTLQGNDQLRVKNACNLLIQEMKAHGMHLWTMTEGYLFPALSTAKHDFASARLTNSYVKTSTSAAALTGASTITVASVTGIANGYVIGVLLEDNTIQWTTVNGAPAGLVVTLTDTLTDDVNSGAAVFCYDGSVTFKPIERILDVRRIDSSDNEIELMTYSREEYMQLPSKDSSSTPVIAYTSRQLSNYLMYIWPTVSTEETVISFTYERKIEVIDDSEDTFDIPEYWFNALVLNLAVRIGPRFGCNPARLQELKFQAKDALDVAMSFDNDMADLRFCV